MTYEQFNKILDNTKVMSYEKMIRTKADATLMVTVGQDGGFATLEALDVTVEDVNEHAPHCLRTVAGWRAGFEASKD